jgi:uncharacterized repeat protein (TIGR01451 family)
MKLRQLTTDAIASRLLEWPKKIPEPINNKMAIKIAASVPFLIISFYLSKNTQAREALVNFDCQGVFIRTSAPSSANPGEILKYTIDIRNEAGCPIKDAVVMDFLPRESRFVSASPEPTIRPEAPGEPRLPVAKVEWVNVPLKPSQSADSADGRNADIFEVLIKVGETPGRVITNTACVEHPTIGRRCDTFDTYVRRNQE